MSRLLVPKMAWTKERHASLNEALGSGCLQQDQRRRLFDTAAHGKGAFKKLAFLVGTVTE